ncbi:MAG: hypothetical protein AB7L92_09355 [Alphaproteobacteria bacterium]
MKARKVDRYQDKPGWAEMKQQMSRGLVATGVGKNKESSFAVFFSYSDASLLERVTLGYGKERTRVFQLLFDKQKMKQIGDGDGVVIEQGQRPMPAPPGQVSVFYVPLSLDQSDCERLLPDLVASGKVVDINDPRINDRLHNLFADQGRSL